MTKATARRPIPSPRCWDARRTEPQDTHRGSGHSKITPSLGSARTNPENEASMTTHGPMTVMGGSPGDRSPTGAGKNLAGQMNQSCRVPCWDRVPCTLECAGPKPLHRICFAFFADSSGAYAVKMSARRLWGRSLFEPRLRNIRPACQFLRADLRAHLTRQSPRQTPPRAAGRGWAPEGAPLRRLCGPVR